MKTRLLLAMTCVAALAACNSNKEGSNASNASNASASSNAAAEAPAGNGAATRTIDPSVAKEMEMMVGILKPRLPLQSGPVTILDLSVNGAELIQTMQVPEDITQESFQVFRERFPTQACANAQIRRLIERGVTSTYRIRDSGGEEFTTSLTSCP